MYSHGKNRVINVYTQTKEEYIEKPQKIIADILQSKYETLKEQYSTVKKVDELYSSGKKVAEAQKERAVEVYSKTCKYYNDQKETVKQLGQELIRHTHEYLKETLSKEDNSGNYVNKKEEPHSLKEIGFEMINLTKQEMENLTKKYFPRAHDYYIKSLSFLTWTRKKDFVLE